MTARQLIREVRSKDLERKIEGLRHLATSAIVARLKDEGATKRMVCRVLKRECEDGLGYMQGRGAA